MSRVARRPRCLLGCSGSVATLKVPELAVKISESMDVIIVATEKAMHFLERAETYNSDAWKLFLSIGGWDLVLTDSSEWSTWNRIGDFVLHIKMRNWADIVIVAPASADLLAKAAAGVCDNMLLCVLRAWDLQNKPCIMCPAMNTLMWNHPSTDSSIRTVEAWGVDIISPQVKLLACNDTGRGAMASVEEIVAKTKMRADIVASRMGEMETDDEFYGVLKMLSMGALSKSNEKPYWRSSPGDISKKEVTFWSMMSGVAFGAVLSIAVVAGTAFVCRRLF